MRFNYATTEKYPWCGEVEEIIPHMLRVHIWNTAGWKADLNEGLTNAGIGPQTRALSMYNAKSYVMHYDLHIGRDYDMITQCICADQAQLGWQNFLQGKLIPEWGDIINKECQIMGLQYNPTTARVPN